MMPTKVDNSTNIPDIDSYRDLLSSGYSVFQSKISGKLGLLIELEKINGFSCTYNVYTKDGTTTDNISYKDCKVYWSINWNTENFNINPAHIVLTKSKWISKDLGVTGGTWFSWVYDGTKNQAIPNADHSMAAPPIAFGEGEYWYADITRQYNPTDTSMTYTNFITRDSYEKKLEAFITTVKSGSSNPYADVELIKLNIVRSDIDGYIGLPSEGNYYINLASMERVGNTYKAYTENLNSPTMYTEINPTAITDDIVNNYFNTSISKYFSSFRIPVKQVLNDIEYTPNITNLIYNYEITPAMDYGILQEYAIEGYIDFSKVGTGAIDLTYWKYYNTENSSTLSIGLDAYVEENKGIAEVALEFYDNQGKAATYHIRNKESYSGTFTEFIPLNGAASSPNLTSTDSNGEPIYHLGTSTTKLGENVIYGSGNVAHPLYYKGGKAYENSNFTGEHTSTSDLYINDAGTIYSNALYLVKIIVKYCQKDALGELDTSISTEFKTYYRWFWTNTMYNQYYSNTSDFDNLPFILNLDINTVYSSSNGYYYETKPYISPFLKQKTTTSTELYKNSGSTIQIVSSDATPNKHNTKYYLQAGLSNNYNTFRLRGNTAGGNYSGLYTALQVDIFTDCDRYVENVNKDPELLHGGQSNYGEWLAIRPVLPENFDKTKIGGTLRTTLAETKFPVNTFYDTTPSQDMWEGPEAYKDCINSFEVTDFATSTSTYSGTEEYLAYNNTVQPLQNKHYISKVLKDIYDDAHAGTFTANIIHFSKYYYTNIEENATAPCLVPLLRELEDLNTYGLGLANTSDHAGVDKVPYISYMYSFEMWDDADGDESHLNVHKYSYAKADGGRTYVSGWSDDWGNSEDHGVFGGYDGYFWRDRKNEWMSHKVDGFFLHGIFMHHDSKYGGSADYNPNNGKDRWFSKSIGDNWKRLYGNVSPQDYCVSRNYEWNYGWEGGGNHIIGIGYNGDENNVEHYFNTYFLISGDPQIPKFASAYSSKLPKYIGQYIATILCGIYLYKVDEAQRVLRTNDIVHLENNYTVYTKDIIYKAQISPSYTPATGELGHNGLLLLQDIQFTSYINTVKSNIAGLTANDVNDSNVTLTLKGCIKNNPIQYKLEYLTPKYDDLSVEGQASAVITKADGTRVPVSSANFEKDKLYWLDENEKVLPLNKNFSAQCVDTIDDSDTYLKVKYNSAWGRMKFPNIYKMFKWVGDKLQCAYTTTAPSSSDRYSMHGQEEEDFAIHDLRKDEVLIPIGNLMKPTEIPLPS